MFSKNSFNTYSKYFVWFLLVLLWFLFGIWSSNLLNLTKNYDDNIYWFSSFCGVDSDQDGVIDILEDINHSVNLMDDDTDGDGIPNFLDKDDDNDWIFTIFEDINHNGNAMDDDTDGDGIANFLDNDDNNNWISNLNEILKLNNITKNYRDNLVNDITNPNSSTRYNSLQQYIKYISVSKDWDNIPDYLQNNSNLTNNKKDLLTSYGLWLSKISSTPNLLNWYSDRIIYYPWQNKYTYKDILLSPIIKNNLPVGFSSWDSFILSNNLTWWSDWSLNKYTDIAIQTIYKYIYDHIYNTWLNYTNQSWSQNIYYVYNWYNTWSKTVTTKDNPLITNTWNLNNQNNIQINTNTSNTPVNLSSWSENKNTWSIPNWIVDSVSELKPFAKYFRCDKPFWLTPIEHGKSIIAYQESTVNYPNTCKSENRLCDNGTLAGSFKSKNCIEIWRDCQTPWGNIIKHWESIIAYSASSVDFGKWCDSVLQNRKCIDWQLWWSANFKFQNCQQNKPKSCVWPDGKIFLHDQVATYYEYPKVVWEFKDWEDICPRQARKCFDWSFYNLDQTKKVNFTFVHSQCVAVVE